MAGTFRFLSIGSHLAIGALKARTQNGAPPAADPSGPLDDPVQLPVRRGRLQPFTPTPRGNIDGLVLAGEPRRKTKHLEVRATRDDMTVEVQAGFDGEIHQVKPVNATDGRAAPHAA